MIRAWTPPGRERPPAWATILLLAVAGVLAFLAAGTAVSASEQSGLPADRVGVVEVEDGSCGKSGSGVAAVLSRVWP